MEKSLVSGRAKPEPLSRSTLYPLPFRLALRMKGALKMLGLRKHEALLPRLLFMGADPGDTISALATIHSPEDWLTNWSDLASHYEERGQHALEHGNLVSAADALRLAAIYYRIAEYMVNDAGTRASLWRNLVRCYCMAGRFFTPPLDVFHVTVEQMRIPVYIRVPVTQQSVPCVITLGGVDGVKEEWYQISQGYLERGWACVALDLPGQGELRRLQNQCWRPDPEVILSTVIDALETYPSIDARRIALVGGSAGGYFALRTAAYDERLISCALISSPVSLTDVYHTAPPPIPQTIDYNLGSINKTESLRMLHAYDAESMLEHIHCPVWLVYGGKDTTTLPHHGQKIKEKVRGEVTELYYPDGDHICFNHLVDWQLHLHNWLEQCFQSPQSSPGTVPVKSYSNGIS